MRSVRAHAELEESHAHPRKTCDALLHVLQNFDLISISIKGAESLLKQEVATAFQDHYGRPKIASLSRNQTRQVPIMFLQS